MNNEERSQYTRESYEANPKLCPECGKKLPFERRRAKFCNSSCSAKYNNRGIVRNPRKIRYCECGKERLSDRKYCPDCAKKYMISPRVTLEEAKTDRTRKVIVIRLLGYQCGICGISEWMEAPIRLELDHIDGNADNNNLDNLRVLCPNCHSQTDTYKGANAGKNSARQQMRRKRYSEGKTY